MTQSLERLFERGRENALLCWSLFAAVALYVAYSLWSGEFVGAALGTGVAVAIVAPYVAARSPWLAVPFEVVLVAVVALALREVVAGRTAAYVGNYLVIASIALLLAVEVHVYTRVELQRTFAALLATMLTLTAAAVWSLARWAADLTVGTAFLASNEALMWELLTATAAGFGAGTLFAWYLRRRPLDGARPSAYEPPEDPTPDDGESPALRQRRDPSLADRLGASERSLRATVRAVQVALAGVAVVGVLRVDVALIVTGSGALAVTLLPRLLRREYDVPLGVGVTLWIASAVFLHSLGTLYFYGDYFWWHNLTHAVSGSLIAGVGFALFRAVDEYTSAVRFPPRFMFALILLFVVSVGVVWEIGEFLTDRLVYALGGTDPAFAQYGLHDTMTDLVFNLAGAVVVAIWGTAYLTDAAAGFRNRLRSWRS